jgi:hypothetical protein
VVVQAVGLAVVVLAVQAEVVQAVQPLFKELQTLEEVVVEDEITLGLQEPLAVQESLFFATQLHLL